MILVTTDFISGKTIRTIGMVKGSTIRSRHIGKDILSGLKSIVGGELTTYQEMINEARAIATKRMVDEAQSLKADAIINVRYATSSVAQNAAEVLAYGTAVSCTEE